MDSVLNFLLEFFKVLIRTDYVQSIVVLFFIAFTFEFIRKL